MSKDFWDATVTFDGETITRRRAALRREAAGVPLAETLAAFQAGAATFADGKWEPSTYKGGPNKGQPCERHPVTGKARPLSGEGVTPQTTEPQATVAQTTVTPQAASRPAVTPVCDRDGLAGDGAERNRKADRDNWNEMADMGQWRIVLNHLGAETSPKQTLAIAVQACRLPAIRSLLPSPVMDAALNTAARYLAGAATKAEYTNARHDASTHALRLFINRHSEGRPNIQISVARLISDAINACNIHAAASPAGIRKDVAGILEKIISHADKAKAAGGERIGVEPKHAVCELIRDIAGNPFEPTPTAKNPDAAGMARELKKTPSADLFRILADNQEDHGASAAADALRRAADDTAEGGASLRGMKLVAELADKARGAKR